MGTAQVLFLQLALVLGLASFIGYLVRLFRLPLLVGYLVAGVIFSLVRVFDWGDSYVLHTFPEIGIAFVLFFVGMEMNLREIKSLGWAIVVIGILQTLVSGFLGGIIASVLGFSRVESILLGAGLAFSSTIVVVKLLTEKRELSSLYGRLSLGILLLEDLIAIVFLMVMSVGDSFLGVGFQNVFPVLALFVKGGLLLFGTFVFARYVLRKVFLAVAQSTELVFLCAISWCFIFVAVSVLLGFSVVVGAFLAGVALAGSPFYWEIQGKVRPLRDFFVVLFFVYLGSQVVFQNVVAALGLILIFSVYAIVVKPIIFLLLLGVFGFKKHTIFQTSVNLSQISEFSLVLLVVGVQLGMASGVALTGIALAAVFTNMFSSIIIYNSRKFYKKLSAFVGLFEHGKFVHQVEIKVNDEVQEGHVVLVGAHRMGGEIIRFLRRERVPLVVLDFNPRVIQNLVNEKVSAMYGDVGDPEILEFLNVEKARFIISTAPALDDNLILLSEVKRREVKVPVIVRASTVFDAKALYGAGADYVILPEVVSGEFVVQVLKSHWGDLEFFKNRASVELNRLFRNRFAFE